MNAEENPYQSPAVVPIEHDVEETASWSVAFGVGVAFAGLSVIALFLRNLPPGGPLLVALITFAVVAIASRKNRLRSAIAFGLCLLFLGGVFLEYRVTRMRVLLEQERARAQAAMERARQAEVQARQAIERQQSTTP